jgi:hypothetical protein
VPIVTDITYYGFFPKEYSQPPKDASDAYGTATPQKLLVAHNLGSGLMSCYVMTIIPAKECAAKNATAAAKLFYKDSCANFSGAVVYNTLTNSTVCIERYRQGKKYASASMFNSEDCLGSGLYNIIILQ